MQIDEEQLSLHQYWIQRPANWDLLPHYGEWFQVFPSQDCEVRRTLAEVAVAGHEQGLPMTAVDIRVLEADWLTDGGRATDRCVLVVLVYRMEDETYLAVSNEPLVHVELRHTGNVGLQGLRPAV